MRRAQLAKGLREVASAADLVVVSIHADLEFTPVPAAWRRRLSRWLIRQGADLVIQHHPHVLHSDQLTPCGHLTHPGGFVRTRSGQQLAVGAESHPQQVVSVV